VTSLTVHCLLIDVTDSAPEPPRAVVEQACGLFYTYIPHAFGRQRAPLLTLDDIQASPGRDCH
jgi:hypothetical protein